MGRQIGVNNPNWRAGALRERAEQIRRESQDPAYIHPRDAKLARLQELMDRDDYLDWYEGYRYTRRPEDRDAKIDAKLAEYQDAELQLLQAQAKQIELDLEESVSPEVRQELMEHLAEVANRLQVFGDAIGTYGEARFQASRGVSL